MPFITDGKIGVDPLYLSSNSNMTLGTTVSGTDGSSWIYACAEGSINKGACVLVRPSGLATQVDYNVLASKNGLIAFSQTLMAASQYAWFQNGGDNVTIRILSANPGAQLWTTNTPGVLDSSADTLSQWLILGVQNAPTTASGTTNMPSCSALFPHFIRYEN